MLLQHAYIHPRPGQKKAQHHAGGSSSGDAATSVDDFTHLVNVNDHGKDQERGRQLDRTIDGGGAKSYARACTGEYKIIIAR
jgi:hypothetical protein